jgi:hypothetical protein
MSQKTYFKKLCHECFLSENLEIHNIKKLRNLIDSHFKK